MDMKERLSQDLREAMRARDEVRTRTIRSLRAALMEREIAERKGGQAILSEEQVVTVLQKQAKQRRESADQYREAGRNDLAAREEEELTVIEEYLPQQLSDSEVLHVIQEIVNEKGATSLADMGKVMGSAMEKLRGRADGKRVQEIVKSVLA